MYSSDDGGADRSPMPALDALMAGNGAFPYGHQRGPTDFTCLEDYSHLTNRLG